MQNASNTYKQSMKSPIRNRGYIKVTLGVINSEAQEHISVDDERNSFTYFSDTTKPFNGYSVDKVYATCEENFSAVDGSMYFLPDEGSDYELYNNGIVTEELLGSVLIVFGGDTEYDIKGLTIDFSDYYPTDFTIANDNTSYEYSGNDARHFVTEDTFDGTTYLLITPTAMVNGEGRLRIWEFSCGIVNTFTNAEVLSFTSKEYVSSITDTLPSMDMTLTVDNQNMYYSPDNQASTLAYFEIGQEMKVKFGYDVLGDGVIEWLPEQTAYIKTWSANETQAKFTATDRFDYLTDTYYKGLYRTEGISLYDLALDVLEDAGITDAREYYVDPYLKDVVVYNPMPVVKHSEALQIIANAGRCALYEDRDSRIHIKSSFLPDMTVSTNSETEYSHAENLLDGTEKEMYAEASQDYSAVDGTMYFMAEGESYLNTGYISESLADENGLFAENPKITITLEAATTVYGLAISFRSTAPQEFTISTYYEGEAVDTVTVSDPDLEYATGQQFDQFDKMVIEVTVGYPNSRVFIDNITIGDVTDYVLERSTGLSASPTATREGKIKSISVVKTIYSESTEEMQELTSEEITLTPDDCTYTVYFSNASYGLTAEIVVDEEETEDSTDGEEDTGETTEEATEEESPYTVEITDSSNYYATLTFGGIEEETTLTFSISGYEYTTKESSYTVKHNSSGSEVIEWSNPLVSTTSHASDLQEWLASYYLGDVEYSINWRGDPRTDANDLFYLELKDGTQTMIRAYQNELKFSGAWSGTIKARKAVL